MSYPKIDLFLWRLRKYIKFFWFSRTKWRIHSPFVYKVCTEVLVPQKTLIGFQLEKIRFNYMKSHEILEIEDYGAGFNNQKKLKIYKKLSEVTKSSARKRKQGELIYRIIKHQKPQYFLELGTNLGFSTAYIAYALNEIFPNNYKFISVEGSLTLYQKACILLKDLQLNVFLVHDTFDNFLNSQKMNNLEGVFIDGNHTFDATVRYFQILKENIKNGGFMIFDDIYWNQEMYDAWNFIKKDPDVTLSIDLYDFGWVFIKKNQAKEHFKLWY